MEKPPRKQLEQPDIPNSEYHKRFQADRFPSVEFERNDKLGFQALRFLNFGLLLV